MAHKKLSVYVWGDSLTIPFEVVIAAQPPKAPKKQSPLTGPICLATYDLEDLLGLFRAVNEPLEHPEECPHCAALEG